MSAPATLRGVVVRVDDRWVTVSASPPRGFEHLARHLLTHRQAPGARQGDSGLLYYTSSYRCGEWSFVPDRGLPAARGAR